MEDEEYLNGLGGISGSSGETQGIVGVCPASSLAWIMFSQTGLPGFYMLYRDIERADERTIFD